MPLLMSSCFDQIGEKVPFLPLFKNIGEKPAYQKGGFSATFSSKFTDSTSGGNQLEGSYTSSQIHSP
jgi:hypothetical protein